MLQTQITIYDLWFIFVAGILVIATYLAYVAGGLDERKKWIEAGYSVKEMKRLTKRKQRR